MFSELYKAIQRAIRYLVHLDPLYRLQYVIRLKNGSLNPGSAISWESRLTFPQANTSHWPNVGLMLVQRRRRWTNINPTLGQYLVFAGRQLHIFFTSYEVISSPRD